MTAKEFVAEQAKRFGLVPNTSFDGDVDLRVVTIEGRQASASDLIQLAAILQEAEYSIAFMKDNSVHVHAPHRKEHSWSDRGWDCTHGLTIEGCEVFHTP
jgi:hypothetical protein